MRRGAGQINDPPPNEGASIIDSHDDRATAAMVRYPHAGPERQVSMRCSHDVLIESLSTGGATAMEAGPIPRRLACLRFAGGDGARLLAFR